MSASKSVNRIAVVGTGVIGASSDDRSVEQLAEQENEALMKLFELRANAGL